MPGSNWEPVINGSPYSSFDPYTTTAYGTLPNGAYNPLGTRYTYPLNPAAAIGTPPYKGLGAPLSIAYVQYVSSSAPALLAAPGLVYWVDKSFSSVTGVYSESAFGINGVAGYMLLNTTSYPGSLTGAQLAALLAPTATTGGYVWIAVGGYVPGATSITSVAAGDYLIGSTTTFTPARMAANAAPTNTVAGMAVTGVSTGGLSDVLLKNFGPYSF
jgi:hypothetical protein